MISWLSLSFWIKIILFFMVTIGSFFEYFRQMSVTGLATDGRLWQIMTPAESHAGTLHGDSTITAWIMLLRLSDPVNHRKRTLVLLPDALPSADWRRLRVLASQQRQGMPGKKA